LSYGCKNASFEALIFPSLERHGVKDTLYGHFPHPTQYTLNTHFFGYWKSVT